MKSKKIWLTSITLSLISLLGLAACGDQPAGSSLKANPTALSGNAPQSASSVADSQPTKAAVGFAAPDFSGPTVLGQPLQLSSLRGKAVILNFWAVY